MRNTQKTPLVSIIIPTYKRKDVLPMAIKSALSQTYSNLEILVVDDDPECSAQEMVADFKNPRLVYLKNDRVKGGNGARNTGIVYAQGEYVAFLDDDDEWYPEKLSKVIMLLETLAPDWAAAYSGFDLVHGNGKKSVIDPVAGSVKVKYMMKRFNIGASSTLVFNKATLIAIGMWNERLKRNQDVELLIRYLREHKLAYVPESLVRVNGHNDPEPYSVVREREVFFEEIRCDIEKLNLFQRRLFFSKQYREFAWFFSRKSMVKKTLWYLLLSFVNLNFNAASYLPVFYYLIKSKAYSKSAINSIRLPK